MDYVEDWSVSLRYVIIVQLCNTPFAIYILSDAHIYFVNYMPINFIIWFQHLRLYHINDDVLHFPVLVYSLNHQKHINFCDLCNLWL